MTDDVPLPGLPILGPEDVGRIRSELKLTALEAGAVIGGGEKAFYKYEANRIAPTLSMSNLLHLLDRAPTLLKVLRGVKLTRGDTAKIASELNAYEAARSEPVS